MRKVAIKVVNVIQRLYHDSDDARAILLRINVPVQRISAFKAPHTFWTGMVLELENGIIKDGLRTLVDEAFVGHPYDLELQEVRAELEAARPPAHGPAAAGRPTVLCLFTDPLHTRASPSEEERDIRKALGQGGIRPETRPAVRVRDIQAAIAEVQPNILHFSGLGEPNGQLIMGRQAEGEITKVDAPALAAAISAALGSGTRILDCLILNSCFTADRAESFGDVTRLVVGSTTLLSEPAARAFSHGFYTALALGRGADAAAEGGLAQMRLEGHSTAGMRVFRPAGSAGEVRS